MPIPVNIESGASQNKALVTKSGELVVAPLAYSRTSFNELAEVDTAYNFYKPLLGRQFVLTSMLTYGDKQVGSNTNATVVIYEADNGETTDVDKVVLQYEIGQNQSISMSPLNILIGSGVFLNAKTDDDDIHMTLMGYYITELD